MTIWASVLVASTRENQMNTEILNNLYEFWTYIGEKTNKLIKKDNYRSILLTNSDWPNRVFSVLDKDGVLSEIIDLSQRRILANIITVPRPNSLGIDARFELFSGQTNMALDLKLIGNISEVDENIHQVKSKNDALNFAKAASKAFGYIVDAEIINQVVNDSSKVRIFNYLKKNECLGCGIVFFDSNNNAGLHMIGTVPQGRGQGIGTRITERLILESKSNKSEYCVLHASLMGEKMYKKLGFVPFGNIETYRVLDTADTA